MASNCFQMISCRFFLIQLSIQSTILIILPARRPNPVYLIHLVSDPSDFIPDLLSEPSRPHISAIPLRSWQCKVLLRIRVLWTLSSADRPFISQLIPVLYFHKQPSLGRQVPTISHTPPPKEKVDFIASEDVIRIP